MPGKTSVKLPWQKPKRVSIRADHLFLDCREPKEYKMGHIPGAMNIPRGLLEFKIEKRFPTRTKTW
jgi:rhodanese-related sulfurtransferase